MGKQTKEPGKIFLEVLNVKPKIKGVVVVVRRNELL